MAKLYPTTKDKTKLDVSDTLFLNIVKDDSGSVKQFSIVNMLSPIKCELVYNKYVSSGLKKSKEMKSIETEIETKTSEFEHFQTVTMNRIEELQKQINKTIYSG